MSASSTRDLQAATDPATLRDYREALGIPAANETLECAWRYHEATRHAHRGHLSEAVAEYRRLLQLDPEQPIHYLDLAEIYLKKDAVKEAIAVLIALTEVYERLGMPGAAVEVQDRALRLKASLNGQPAPQAPQARIDAVQAPPAEISSPRLSPQTGEGDEVRPSPRSDGGVDQSLAPPIGNDLHTSLAYKGAADVEEPAFTRMAEAVEAVATDQRPVEPSPGIAGDGEAASPSADPDPRGGSSNLPALDRAKTPLRSASITTRSGRLGEILTRMGVVTDRKSVV